MIGMKRIAIIGSGPAGLMAAQSALEQGAQVSIYEAMPSAARKFLMAGKSGLNISHSENVDQLLGRYGAPDGRLKAMVSAFNASDIRDWMEALDEPSFVGSSGRIFPVAMKASPLLRKWLRKLAEQGAELHTRHRWTGWTPEGLLAFSTQTGVVEVESDATILALGGKSWSRLGSDGQWTDILSECGVSIDPFEPSNCGMEVGWSNRLLSQHEGAPVKSIALKMGDKRSRGDIVITRHGIESGALYPVAADLRKELSSSGSARLLIDLVPDVQTDALAKRLASANRKDSMSNRLRKAARLDKAKVALVNEVTRGSPPGDPSELTALLKALPLTVTGTAPMDDAISTAGGVSWDALDEHLMLKAVPNTYCVGEMVSWDAPTGGYLLTACMAMGKAAGEAAAKAT
jgi:hypothetical protein